MQDWDNELMHKKLPLPEGDTTVLHHGEINPDKFQAFYLWEKDNMPAITNFTPNMVGYFDNYDFRPFITALPKPNRFKPKGAVILLAGGAYQFRSNYTDALSTAAALREEGFQAFVLDYRVFPYDQKEVALDVARAIRFVRANAESYGLNDRNIAIMGFSSGAIQAGEFLMNYKGKNGKAIDSDYEPDELDEVSDKVAADGMIYGFYGQLSVGNTDGHELQRANLPPTFYVYGTNDPFYRQYDYQYQVLKMIGVPVSRVVLNEWGHGFGADGGWIKDFSSWLESVFRP